MIKVESGLVYVGKFISIEDIPKADFIGSATVVCGRGGKWKGVIRKDQFSIGDLCMVFLPDAVLVPCDDIKFMEASGWRVKMRRFRGAPSEVLILGVNKQLVVEVGQDMTEYYGVTKYYKEVPANLSCDAKGDFPGFIPKTDEPNYQRHPELVERLVGKAYYVTEKCDGSSTTAYRYKGEFGVCSRNYELLRKEESGYWQVVKRYGLEDKLPEGYAVQWETCGPKIQGNPMRLAEVDGYAFGVYDIVRRSYLGMREMIDFLEKVGFPMVKVIAAVGNFSERGMEVMGEGKYDSGHPIEGVVVRSQEVIDGRFISFKVMNLGYEDYKEGKC